MKNKQPVKQRTWVKLQEIIDTHGLKSNEFFTYCKPFFIKNLNRFITPGAYGDDVIVDTYYRLLRACFGYWKIDKKTKEKIFMPAYYDPKKCKNIGNFIIQCARNTASAYYHKISKIYKENANNEYLENFSELTIIDTCNTNDNLGDNQIFTNIKVSNNFINSLILIQKYKPTNNIFYNFLLWNNYAEN